MVQLYNTLIYEPLFNALIWFYHIIPGNNMAIAIIVLTLLIKTLLLWPSFSAIRAQKQLQETQPKIDAIREKYKDDKEELGKKLMEFYKTNKVNPFASCLPLIIQLPILLALYRAFFRGLQVDAETGILQSEQVQRLYGWLAEIYSTTPLETVAFGVDLAAPHNIILAVLAGGAQYLQAKSMQARKPEVKSDGAKDENAAAMVTKQMTIILPIMTVVFGYQFPAGVTLYWLVSTVYSYIQQRIILNGRSSGGSGNVIEATAKDITSN